MWDTVLPKLNCSWEPVELRILKQELANMTCQCKACESFKNPSIHYRSHSECNDEAIQVDLAGTHDMRPKTIDCMTAGTFCPNCYVFLDLLQRGNKVFKDEELETTKPDSADISTEKSVTFIDNSTSVTNKPVLKPLSSNLTFCDFLSDCSMDSLSTANSPTTEKKSNQHERVTFLEDFPHIDTNKIKSTITNTMQGNCFCLDSFMNSIRPPLNDVL